MAILPRLDRVAQSYQQTVLIRRRDDSTNEYHNLYLNQKVLIEDATSPSPDLQGYVATDYQFVAFINPTVPDIPDPQDPTLLTNIRVTDELVLENNTIYYVIRIPPESGRQDVQVLYLSNQSRIS